MKDLDQQNEMLSETTRAFVSNRYLFAGTQLGLLIKAGLKNSLLSEWWCSVEGSAHQLYTTFPEALWDAVNAVGRTHMPRIGSQNS